MTFFDSPGKSSRGIFCCLLLGRRHLAVELSLFAAKKRRKNRHRFDAVDADQGCGFLYRARHDIKNNTKCWFLYWSAAHSGQWLGEKPYDGLLTGWGR